MGSWNLAHRGPSKPHGKGESFRKFPKVPKMKFSDIGEGLRVRPIAFRRKGFSAKTMKTSLATKRAEPSDDGDRTGSERHFLGEEERERREGFAPSCPDFRWQGISSSRRPRPFRSSGVARIKCGPALIVRSAARRARAPEISFAPPHPRRQALRPTSPEIIPRMVPLVRLPTPPRRSE